MSTLNKINSEPVLLGHSLGGALALELVLQRALKPAALVLSSPALKPNMSHWQQVQLKAMRLLAPNVVIDKNSDPNALTTDPIEVQAHRDDPLNHSKVSARLIHWLVTSGAKSLSLADTLTTPTLLLVAGADRVVDPTASLQFSAIAGEHVTLKVYDGYRHEIFNETEQRRQRAFADVAGWLDNFKLDNRR